jgi:hypothetical protein
MGFKRMVLILRVRLSSSHLGAKGKSLVGVQVVGTKKVSS